MDLREQKFGVEVEMTGITRKRAAQVIGEYLNGSVNSIVLTKVWKSKLKNELNKIKDNDLQKAAQQFEAIFLRNMLKEMRKTNEIFDSKDNPFNSDSVRMMQGFYDDQLCNSLAQQHGIGIAAMIVKQLSPHHKG